MAGSFEAARSIRLLNSVLQDPQISEEQSARCLIFLSRIAQAGADGPNALELARRALELAQTAQGSAPYSNRTGLAWLMLGRILKAKGDEVGGRQALQAAVDNLSNTVDADNPQLLLARHLAGVR
jgi:hypothetical protein